MAKKRYMQQYVWKKKSSSTKCETKFKDDANLLMNKFNIIMIWRNQHWRVNPRSGGEFTQSTINKVLTTLGQLLFLNGIIYSPV